MNLPDYNLTLKTVLKSVFRLLTGKLLLNLMDHTDIVRDLTFAPDGSLVLVSASRDKTLRVWDLKDDGEALNTSLAWEETAVVLL